MIQSGIFSDKGLERALENSFFAENFIHISDSNPIKFDYVQNILNRSRERILNYLKKKPDYNLDNMAQSQNQCLTASITTDGGCIR